MFRFLSRVVVVSVLALSLNFVVVPAAQARPQEAGKAAPGTVKSWMEEAMDWLNRILSRESKSSDQGPKKIIANDGGVCIDPNGKPRPCP
jgi:hypothetical protein